MSAAPDVAVPVPVPATSAAPQRTLATIRARLVPPMPSRWWIGWLGPLVVTLIGGILRWVDLGRPHALVFDETYYAKDALSLLRFGYERNLVDGANDILLGSNGNIASLDIFQTTPEYVVHPPLGKWTIAVGEWLFGATPFGWRWAVAVLGTLTVLMTARIVRRLTRSDLLGTVAGLLLAVEGLSIVMSRTAILDMVLTFWVLAAFGCLLLDRDRTRSRLADLVERRGAAIGAGLGPHLGWRPWRIAAGACLGAACAVKWSGLWFLAAFALLSLCWDIGSRKAVGVRNPWWATALRDVVPAAVSFVAVAVAVYLVSWTGWFLSDDAYSRQWGDDSSVIPAALRSLWHYHAEAWRFHTTLSSAHSYQSSAFSWPFQSRPTSFYYEGFDRGQGGCTDDKCSAEVLALGNPVIWWAGLLALLHQVWRWFAHRDWRSGAIVLAVLAGWVPWLIFPDRTIFTFYAVVYVPFVVAALTMSLGSVLGRADGTPRRRTWGALVAGIVVLAAVAAGWWFYPIWTGELLPYAQWNLRMWLPTWV
ncbi:MAG: phospholipid carrier-dependent glycosyltransferase [Actinomycetota bacterium]|nr:MAG: phospholipid carrier-dependent glycosyltransferase [Actinomycetota bacterium]